MPAITSRTFPVDRVQHAQEPLPEIAYPEAVAEHVCGGHAAHLPESVAHTRRSLAEEEGRVADTSLPEARRRAAADRLKFVRSILATEEQALLEARPPEACSRYYGRLVAGLSNHPFLAAVAQAYADHRPLVLSPDVVWLLIAQGAAAHINANAEELRAGFVRHAGQRELRVVRPDFCCGSPENPWPEVFSAFSEGVARHVGPETHAFFVPSFSTTGPVERAAFEVTLLDAMRAYFRYSICFVCGIPEITLEGTTADWRELASRAERLDSFGLGRWRMMLRPVLQQFIRAAQGNIDTGFWRSIYRRTPPTCDFSRPRTTPEVTGWIVLFFPYLRDRSGRPPVPAPWMGLGASGEGWFAGSDLGFSTRDAGSGVSVAPFGLELPGGECREMEFLAGFLGVAQDPRTLALRPEIGWAVRQAPPPRRDGGEVEAAGPG
jgi:Domain of unknown function (DUF4419)